MENNDSIQLMKFSHGGGCGCKISPQVLEEILAGSAHQSAFAQLLVGNSSKDDAAVYQLNESEALIATTDFFTPIVNDAYTFGKVAAANAISDVYAMGGKPIMALAILGWPVEKLPTSLAQQVLAGAKAICAEVNIPLAGGHSIDTPEPVFGLSVNGLVAINQLKKNNTAREGDLLLLTKPLGIGVFSTAAKRGVLSDTDLKIMQNQLTQVNSIGAELSKLAGVSAMTDVTGFGLAGHLNEMAEGSSLTAEINYNKVPKLPGLEAYLSKNIFPDATLRNWKSYGEKLNIAPEVNYMEAFQLLPDPQTNGGLLIAIAPESLTDVQAVLNKFGYSNFTEPIGKMLALQDKSVLVVA